MPRRPRLGGFCDRTQARHQSPVLGIDREGSMHIEPCRVGGTGLLGKPESPISVAEIGGIGFVACGLCAQRMGIMHRVIE